MDCEPELEPEKKEEGGQDNDNRVEGFLLRSGRRLICRGSS